MSWWPPNPPIPGQGKLGVPPGMHSSPFPQGRGEWGVASMGEVTLWEWHTWKHSTGQVGMGVQGLGYRMEDGGIRGSGVR